MLLLAMLVLTGPGTTASCTSVTSALHISSCLCSLLPQPSSMHAKRLQRLLLLPRLLVLPLLPLLLLLLVVGRLCIQQLLSSLQCTYCCWWWCDAAADVRPCHCWHCWATDLLSSRGEPMQAVARCIWWWRGAVAAAAARPSSSWLFHWRAASLLSNHCRKLRCTGKCSCRWCSAVPASTVGCLVVIHKARSCWAAGLLRRKRLGGGAPECVSTQAGSSLQTHLHSCLHNICCCCCSGGCTALCWLLLRCLLLLVMMDVLLPLLTVRKVA
jgi:hypothetical protein